MCYRIAVRCISVTRYYIQWLWVCISASQGYAYASLSPQVPCNCIAVALSCRPVDSTVA